MLRKYCLNTVELFKPITVPYRFTFKRYRYLTGTGELFFVDQKKFFD